MQTKDSFLFQFDFLRQTLGKVTDGLTAEELSWQPGIANSIGFLMLHIARSEDLNTMTRFQGKPQVWVTGKWYEKFGLTEDETSFGWSEEKLAAFHFPGVKKMLEYADAVRAETNAFLSTLDEAGRRGIPVIGLAAEPVIDLMRQLPLVSGLLIPFIGASAVGRRSSASARTI